MAKSRDTYKYHFKVGNRVFHSGITENLERREEEHQQKWPSGHIKQVGRRTTEEAAREWENKQKKSSKNSFRIGAIAPVYRLL